MRSTEDVRARALDHLRIAMARPDTWASTGREMESAVSSLLSDLCFIDQRDDTYGAIREELLRYGKRGVSGPFVKMFGDPRGCVPEVTSIFAEHAFRLGYLELDGLLPAGRLQFIGRGLRSRYDSVDVTRQEIVDDLGPPSLVVNKRVLCYASEDPDERWVFVDVWPQPLYRYERESQRSSIPPEPDPLVRAIRTHADAFETGMILTAFGKNLRWGPGWWIHHPSPTADPAQIEIAAQLRGVAERDPSE